MRVDFAPELSQLLIIASRIAMAIRARVPFDPADPNGLHGSDPFWLADAIHSFGELAECVAAREWSLTDAECVRALRQIEEYRARKPDELGNPMITFNRVGVDLMHIEQVIQAIQMKALAAHRSMRLAAQAPAQSRERKRA